MKIVLGTLFALFYASTVLAASPKFAIDSHFLQSPADPGAIGDSHGDIAVAPNGDIYLSVQGGSRSGVQVYAANGRYIRNLPNAPTDFHGFIITNAGGQSFYLLGVRLEGQQIIKLDLDGKPLLHIDASAIPDQYKTEAKGGQLVVSLTGVAAAPNGDIYAVDGYGRDFIHHFDATGRYLGTFGGDGAPWNFHQCHKIAIDPRFQPVRLLCTDRLHDRIVAMGLDGHVIGTVATGLRWPSALAFHGSEMAVAELGGRVTVLGIHGEVLAELGTNDNAAQVKTNEVPPSQWKDGVFYAPHGIAYDHHGNILVSEWSKWGRVDFLRRVGD
ncbi:hypothetical protein [Dyella mobilis]|uniref:NHL repeat-containing protein n=1 Tax=Dyella mobilis TaxID=1849582 RepID=A0ABS2KCZ0_9GAMM|nr:hypothetical protein [Dyella mobilis]MBM7129039.1 hypothetical protein [Dyella mobilis]GLQ99267.1 hypothetical protein GCM10007863_36870 [Dyella mobilis]